MGQNSFNLPVGGKFQNDPLNRRKQRQVGVVADVLHVHGGCCIAFPVRLAGVVTPKWPLS